MKSDSFGPFEIPEEECVTCGCCQAEAPDNFDWVQTEDGFETMAVVKQAESLDELDAVIRAASVCMVSCIYYHGLDPDISARVPEALAWEKEECKSCDPVVGPE